MKGKEKIIEWLEYDGNLSEIDKIRQNRDANAKSFYDYVRTYSKEPEQYICYKVVREEVKLVKYEDIEDFDFNFNFFCICNFKD